MPTPRLVPLAIQEVAGNDGYTQQWVLTANELTETVANTAQAFANIAPIALGAALQVKIRLRIPFENTADAAHNTTTVSVGDDTSATSLLAAQEVNKNGTEITVPVEGTKSAGYAAANNLKVTVNSMAGKNLNALNKGELHLLVRWVDPQPMLDLKGATGITK